MIFENSQRKKSGKNDFGCGPCFSLQTLEKWTPSTKVLCPESVSKISLWKFSPNDVLKVGCRPRWFPEIRKWPKIEAWIDCFWPQTYSQIGWSTKIIFENSASKSMDPFLCSVYLMKCHERGVCTKMIFENSQVIFRKMPIFKGRFRPK